MSMPQLSDLPKFIEGLSSKDDRVCEESVVAIKKLLSIQRSPPIQQVLDSGCLPALIDLLDVRKSPTLTFEALWAITNLSTGSSAQTAFLLSSGVVPPLVALATSGCDDDIKGQVCWALGNIAGDCITCRDAVLEAGGCEGILHVLEAGATPPSISTTQHAFWTLSNLFRRKPAPAFEVMKPCLPILASGLASVDSNDQTLTDIAWALSYISDGTNDRIQAVVETGCIPKLVQMLGTLHSTAALRVLGNITTGDAHHTQAVLSAGVLPIFKELLASTSAGVRKETCWSLSNITAGPAAQIQMVFDGGIFPILVSLMEDSSFAVVREAAWAVANATSGGTRELVQALVDLGALRSILRLLDVPDQQVLMVALEALENILGMGGLIGNPYLDIVEDNGGLELLDGLQDHRSEQVFQKSSNIIRTYFDTEEEVVGEISQVVVEGRNRKYHP